MAVIRTQISPRLRGGVGDFSYYTNQGVQLVRPRRNVTNYGESARRTEAQQEHRAKWGNLVNVYQEFMPWISRTNTIEVKSKKGLTTIQPFSTFMGHNINVSTAYITKSECAQGAAVVGPYQVCKGQLPRVYCMMQTSAQAGQPALFTVDVKTQDEPVASMPKSWFSDQLILNNDGMIINGDRLHLYIFKNWKDSDDLPRVEVDTRFFEVDRTNHATMAGTWIVTLFNSLNEGRLMFNIGTEDDDVVGACFFISRKVNRRVQVSTAFIEMAFLDLYSEFSSLQKKQESIDSYGVDPSNPLNSMM